MKFTVLGATGFIGSNVCSYLRHTGHDVWAPVHNDLAMFSRPMGHVMYCIGLTADFRERPYDTMRAHVGVLTELLERADFDSFLYLSSTRVYARNLNTSENESISVNVNSPSDLYNISKLAGESLCRSCGRSDVKIARLSNVIGPDLASKNFIFDLVRESIEGQMFLQTSLLSSKDYIWIDDVVRLLAVISTAGSETIYNVASGFNLSHSEIVDKLIHLTGSTIAVLPDAPLQMFPVINTQRINIEFKFRPQGVMERLPELISLFTNLNDQSIKRKFRESNTTIPVRKIGAHRKPRSKC